MYQNEEIKEYKKYINLILVQGYRNIREISETMQCSYNEATDKFSKVISKGYIKGFVIDNKSGQIVDKNQVKKKSDNSIYENTNILRKNQAMPKVCKNCGGNRFVETSDGVRCRYCGGVV